MIETILLSALGVVLWVLIGCLVVAGLVITLVGFPGVWLILIGIIFSAFITSFEQISPVVLIIFTLMTIIASVADNILMVLGTRYSGGSRWAMGGAVVGALVGLVIGNIVGLILGPFVGAFIFELIFAKKDTKSALKAGFGTFIGFVLSILLKFGVGVSMVIIWLFLLIN